MSVPGYFVPARKIIEDIFKSKDRTFVLLGSRHNYSTDLVVRIIVPPGRGMTQLNDFIGPITVLGPLAFYIRVDSSNFDSFITYLIENEEKEHAQVVPIGEYGYSFNAATRNAGLIQPEF